MQFLACDVCWSIHTGSGVANMISAPYGGNLPWTMMICQDAAHALPIQVVSEISELLLGMF